MFDAHHFLWLPLDWHLSLFILGLIVAIALGLFIRYLGLLALLVVLYLGVAWNPYWGWTRWTFWIGVFIALAGLLLFIFDRRDDRTVNRRFGFATSGTRKGTRMLSLGTLLAQVTVLILFIALILNGIFNGAFGSSADDMAKSFNKQLAASTAEVRALTGKVDSGLTAQKTVDEAQNLKIAALETRLDKLEGRVTKLETSVNEIKSGTTSTASPSDVPTDKVARGLAEALAAQGWKAGEVTVGTVNWDANPLDRGTNIFGERIESTQELSRRLNKDTKEAKATRVFLKQQALTDALPDEMVESEYRRALSGKGFVPVQFNKDVCYSGNTFYFNGKAERPNKDSCRKAGDIIWVYVASNGTVIWDASVRADCSNPGLSKVPAPRDHVKHGPKSPPTTPSTRTTTPSTTSTTSTSSTPSTSTTSTTTTTTSPPTSTTSTTPSSTTTTTRSTKDPADHPCNNGNCPSNTHSPAPHPSTTATSPGGGTPSSTYTSPTTSTGSVTSSSPRPTVTPSTTVDPEPSHTATSTPTW